jgi:hypothetical protein
MTQKSSSAVSEMTKPSKFTAMSALAGKKPMSKLRPVEAAGRPVRINLGQTRLCIAEDPAGVVNIDILRNGKRAGTHTFHITEDGTLRPVKELPPQSTRVVLRKQSTPQHVDVGIDAQHSLLANQSLDSIIIDDNGPDSTSRDPTFVTARATATSDSLWNHPADTGRSMKRTASDSILPSNGKLPLKGHMPTIADNEEHWRKMSLVLDQLPAPGTTSPRAVHSAPITSTPVRSSNQRLRGMSDKKHDINQR